MGASSVISPARGIDRGDGAVPDQIARPRSPIQPLVRVVAWEPAHPESRDPCRGAGTGDRDTVAGPQPRGALHGQNHPAGGHGLIRHADRRAGCRIRHAADLDQGAASLAGGHDGRVPAAAQHHSAGPHFEASRHAITPRPQQHRAPKTVLPQREAPIHDRWPAARVRCHPRRWAGRRSRPAPSEGRRLRLRSPHTKNRSVAAHQRPPGKRRAPANAPWRQL